jgi:hypothetical protein
MSTARLAVSAHRSSTKDPQAAMKGPWTEVRESQQGFRGTFLVGYNTDKNQFLMIDADDPISISYQTSGWQGSELLLLALTDDSQLPHRTKFDVTDQQSFNVTWEALEGPAWKEDPAFTCRRLAPGEAARRKR